MSFLKNFKNIFTSVPSAPSVPSVPFAFEKKPEYLNSKGQTVPAELMKDKNIARQAICDDILPHAQRAASELLALRNKIVKTLREYKQWDAEKYGVKIGEKGNVSVTSFDGNTRVQLRSHPTVVYSEQSIEVAKELMGQVIDENTSSVMQDLRRLFNDAFTPKKDGLSLVSITTLMSYDIPDARWQRGVKALEEGREVMDRAFYVEVSTRNANAQNQWIPIPLDIAKVSEAIDAN
jgi:hypothetical protein